MHIVISEPEVKVPDTRRIIKVLVHTPARHGTFYVSGGQLVSERSKAQKFATPDEAYALIAAHGQRAGLNRHGVLMTVVRPVEVGGESGKR